MDGFFFKRYLLKSVLMDFSKAIQHHAETLCLELRFCRSQWLDRDGRVWDLISSKVYVEDSNGMGDGMLSSAIDIYVPAS